MNTFDLTPRSNNTVESMAFTGSFGQQDGFGSVLEVSVRRDGRLVLTCAYKSHGEEEKQWSVELDNAQRNALVEFAGKYQPTLFQKIKSDL